MWRITLVTDTRTAPRYAEALETLCPTVSWIDTDEDGQVEVEAISEEKPVRAVVEKLLKAAHTPLPQVTIAPLPDTDWLTLSFQSFPPKQLGRFWIHGSHVTTPPPAGSWPLQIDAATAFGSGEHPTTAGCLAALEQLSKSCRFRNILDMGTGSGILAIAAARIFGSRVTAVDIDPESIRVTKNHAEANTVLRHLHLEAGDGFKSPLARRHAPYDLLLANILARPLRLMARDGASLVRQNGYIVLAGLLDTQVNLVLEAWRKQGCRLVRKLKRGEWTILILRKG